MNLTIKQALAQCRELFQTKPGHTTQGFMVLRDAAGWPTGVFVPNIHEALHYLPTDPVEKMAKPLQALHEDGVIAACAGGGRRHSLRDVYVFSVDNRLRQLLRQKSRA